MRKVIVLSMISLDGVIQSPGRPEEDTSGGFKYGGWVTPFSDEVYDSVVQQELKPADYLLGRKTFEIWADYWPEHGDFWPGINDRTKFVYSESLTDSDPLVKNWNNSVILSSPEDIRNLKKTEGLDIQVWGSSELVHMMLKHDLVDELRLKIHPLILGKGKRLFDHGSLPAAYHLTESMVTPGGVIIAFYRRAGMVSTGVIGA